MKTWSILFIAFMASASVAFADTTPPTPTPPAMVCGHLYSQNVRPNCAATPHQVCSQHMIVRFFIADGQNPPTVLIAPNFAVMHALEELNQIASDQRVCATGIPQHGNSLLVQQLFVDTLAGPN